VRTDEPQNIPKNKTTQGLNRVVLLFFPLQSLHPRQGWECSNCSEVLTWWFYFIYPWLISIITTLPCPIGHPPSRHHGR